MKSPYFYDFSGNFQLFNLGKKNVQNIFEDAGSFSSLFYSKKKKME